MKELRHLVSRFRGKEILVVGDIILDQYIHGTVTRISPEAPVPVVLQRGEPTFSLGGASNVAQNLSSLGAKVTLAGIVGKDAEGRLLAKELKKRKIFCPGLIVDKQVPTAVKTRIIAQNQQVVRLDREKPSQGEATAAHEKIIKYVKENISKFDAIILSDYGKGVITRLLVDELCPLAVEAKKIITVDPKVEHFGYYKGVTAITPNKMEAENAIHNIKITQEKGYRLNVRTSRLEKDEQIDEAGGALLKYLSLESLLITLGEQGMRLFERGKKPVYISTRAREIFDVSGAGDTVIAVFTLSLTAGASKRDAAELANYAAGIVVGKAGVVPVTSAELLKAVES